jgi:hypothetical protein
LLNTLKNEPNPCATLKIEKTTCKDFIPEQIKVPLPDPLTELFVADLQQYSLEQLLPLSEIYFPNYKCSQEQIDKIEVLTRNQYKSKLWSNMKEGRITGSSVYSVLHTDIEKPSKTVVQKVCYPLQANFKSTPTQYVCL